VAEKYRHRKIGEKLIEHAKQQAKDFGFEKMYLYTTDKTIHLWYEKLGWKIIKEDILFEKFPIKIMKADL
jgi:N-acetylglutamate synthase-like GNAT family acetyltransferase